MGWKSFKDRLNIRHSVHIDKGRLCIGSPYVPDIVVFDMNTGELKKDGIGNDGRFLRETYPNILNIPATTIKSIIDEPDSFTRAIPIFKFDGENVVRKYTENTGWPNVTHDGEKIYDNTFFESEIEATKDGLETLASTIEFYEKEIVEAAGRKNRYELKRIDRLGLQKRLQKKLDEYAQINK